MKKTIAFDDTVIEYTLVGETGPVIILLNGYRMPISSWDRIYPGITALGQILAYNRHGIGKSSKATCPQTGDEVVRTLEKILNHLNLPPPYILVAHSMAGLIANLYARRHPDKTAGLVFVDAAHPEEKQKQAAFKPPLLLRGMNSLLKRIELIFDKYQHSEDDCIDKTIRLIEESGDFPSIPITILSGGKKMPFVPEASFKIHQQCQKALMSLSPDAIQIIADKSGHFPQITEPDLLIQTIENTIQRAMHR